MELKEILCMNGGEGEASYYKSSFFAGKVDTVTSPMIEKAIRDLCRDKNFSDEVFTVADLGSSSGPGTLYIISEIVLLVAEISREANWRLPEFLLCLNDLPMNDFNTVFRNLAPFQEIILERGAGKEDLSCFIAGVPGSFYGRLFPRKNLHFVRASYSVHWLSRVPPGLRTEDGLPLNKGKIYISKTSPPGTVWEAYLKQFQRDFSLFLKHRSAEIIPDGRMVIVFQGRETIDPTSKEATFPWEMMAEALSRMVQEGTIEKEKLDSFDIPLYIPYSEEIIDEINKEGSFTVERVEIISLDHRSEENVVAIAKKSADDVRTFTEPVIANHFGDKILDELYDKFAQIVEDSPSELDMVTSIFVELKKNNRGCT